MTRMEELESCLSGLLSTLKKNREHVPLEVLKTQYKQPYEELVRNINLTASAYAKSVLLHRLVLNPDADVEEQCTVINQMIQTSGMLKKISSCMSKRFKIKLEQFRQNLLLSGDYDATGNYKQAVKKTAV